MPGDIINVVTIEGGEDSKICGEKIAQLLKVKSPIKVGLSSLDTEGGDSYLLIDHSHQKDVGYFNANMKAAYGNLTGDEFASQFKKAFEKGNRKKDKTAVKHIYLIGCEVGLSSPRENNSLAQEIANKLFKQGFTEVKVHAVAFEQDNAGQGFYVRVIDDGGLLNAPEGFVEAYYVNPEINKRLQDLERKLHQESNQAKVKSINRQIKNLTTLHAQWVITPSHPTELLHRGENTFIHGETYQDRAERLNKDRDYQERLRIYKEKREALRTLDILTRENEQSTDAKAEKNKIIIQNLKTAITRDMFNSITLQAICNKQKAHYDSNRSIVSFGPSKLDVILAALKNKMKTSLQAHPARLEEPVRPVKSVKPKQINVKPAPTKSTVDEPKQAPNTSAPAIKSRIDLLKEKLEETESLIKGYQPLVENTELMMTKDRLLSAFSKVKQKIVDEFNSGKLNYDDANELIDETHKLASAIKDNKLSPVMISNYDKNTRKFQKDWSWKTVLAAFVGAVVGFAIGAIIGAATGPGAILTSVVGGYKGAMIAAALCGVGTSVLSAGSLTLWQQQGDPVKSLGKSAEAIIKQRKPPKIV